MCREGREKLEMFYRVSHLSGRQIETTFFLFLLAEVVGSVGEETGEFKLTGLILA